MKKPLLYTLIAAAAMMVILAAALLVTYVSGGSGEASGTLAAPELSLEITRTDPAADAAQAAPSEAITAGPAAGAATAARRLFRLAQEESEARFELDELLFNQPAHVVGVTDQVAGDIIVDAASPVSSEVGVIVINARTLQTDNELRNRAIRSQILESSRAEYELIRFTPTALEGMPEGPVAVGDTVAFQVTGDLQIRDITRPVTFDVALTAAAGDRIEGTAAAVVGRDAFELRIPNVPGVADVSNEVALTLRFVAREVVE